MRLPRPIQQNLPLIVQLVHGYAEGLRALDDNLAHDLHGVADLIRELPHALPTEGMCPYCRATYLVNHWRPELRGTEQIVGHKMRVVERLCNQSEEYLAGYRALWRCTNPACGETEVR